MCFLGKWEVWDGEQSLWLGDQHSWPCGLPRLTLPPEDGTQQCSSSLPGQQPCSGGRFKVPLKKKIRAQKKDWKEIHQNVSCVRVWVKRRVGDFRLLTSCVRVSYSGRAARSPRREAAICGCPCVRALPSLPRPRTPHPPPEPQPATRVPKAFGPRRTPGLVSFDPTQPPHPHGQAG